MLGVDMWQPNNSYISKNNRDIKIFELIALHFHLKQFEMDAMSKQRLQIIIYMLTKCIVIGTTSHYKKRNYYMVDHADFLW